MPYVETKQIGSHSIVVGFGAPSFDPMATQAAIQPLLEAADEYKALVDTKIKLDEQYQALITLWPLWKATPKGTQQWLDYEAQYKAAHAEVARLQGIASIQDGAVEEKRRALVLSDGIRFELPGVTEIDQATQNSLLSKLQSLVQGTRLLVDGSTIIDKIGVVYWTKDVDTWTKTEITDLGVDVPASDAYLWDDLNMAQVAEIEDQLDIERIAALDPDVREAEKQDMLGQALVSAALKKTEFEIMGVEDPLAASQQWYADRVAWIEARYTVT
jgi:hypothetical protein